MNARLDVVVVAYGSADLIGGVVDRARALPAVGDVVVVDHGRDGSAAIAEEHGARVVVDPTNPGFGAGQNRGVAMTTAPYLLLLNPDAEPEASGIEAGMRILDADPTIGGVQGVITNLATGNPERTHGRELGPVHLVGRALGARRLLHSAVVRRVARRVDALHDHVERAPEVATEVEMVSATCMVVRRTAFDGVGGFDEEYFLYGEDLDLSRRLRAAGWRLLAMPEEFARHENGSSSTSSVERELSWWRGTMRFAALWWSDGAWSGALVAAVLQCVRLSMRQPRVARRAWRALVAEPRRDRKTAKRTLVSRTFGAAAPVERATARVSACPTP